MLRIVFVSLLLGLAMGWVKGQSARERDYYTLVTLPIPEGVVLEGGGIATLPSGHLAVCTRRGDVYIIENPYDTDGQPHFRLFATGLHEALGLAWHDGTLWVTQRGELTRLWDRNQDGYADDYESVYAWPLSGHYHEYSYGPAVAPDGSLYVTTNVSFGSPDWWAGKSTVPWRGWTLRITPEGEMEPFATGMRSPNSLGFFDGEFFYGDNQGDWMGSGALFHVEKGDFTGHPAGLGWSDRPESPVAVTRQDIYRRVDPQEAAPGERPIKPENNPEEEPVPFFAVGKEVKGVKVPAVWLPHGVLGISTAQFIEDQTGGAFGPFEGQLFVGDQGQSKVVRVAMEKVDGVYQGAAFGFFEGFASGVMRLSWGQDGSLFAAQSNRGWGSTGPASYALQRLVWSGKTPFEMKTIRAMPDGFEITFTQPVDKATAEDPNSYQISSFTYKYHPVYGSPAVNIEPHALKGIKVSSDGLRVRLVVDQARQHYIHELTLSGVKAYADGAPLLHPTGYYTLNRIPEGPKLDLASLSKMVPTQKVQGGSAIKEVPQKVSPDALAALTGTPPSNESGLPARKKKTPALAKNQATLPAHWEEGADLTIRMGTEPGLKFSVTDMTVEAGTRIKLIFSNPDDMPHNFILTQPGQADRVGEAALKLGVRGMELNYVPDLPAVLYHTKLLQPSTSQTIYFEAPTEPGVYPYVCTYPGHYVTMRGVLRVK